MEAREFEFTFNIDEAIKSQLIDELNSIPDIPRPITKGDIKVKYPGRDWEVDSNNLSHANFYTEVRIEVNDPKLSPLVLKYIDENYLEDE